MNYDDWKLTPPTADDIDDRYECERCFYRAHHAGTERCDKCDHWLGLECHMREAKLEIERQFFTDEGKR